MRARPDVEAQLDQLQQAGSAGLPSPESRLQFEGYTRRLRSNFAERIGQHTEQQATVYRTGVNDSTADLARQSIAANPEDPEALKHGLADLTTARVKEAQAASGGDPTMMAAAAQRARAEGSTTQVEALLNKNPTLAKSVLENSRTILAPQIYDQLVNRLRPQLAGDQASEAIQRAADGKLVEGGPVMHSPPAGGSPTISDVDALAAEKRLSAGTGTDADRALRATYLQQQNTPPGKQPQAAPGGTTPAATGLPQEGPMPPARGDGGPAPSTDAGSVAQPSYQAWRATQPAERQQEFDRLAQREAARNGTDLAGGQSALFDQLQAQAVAKGVTLPGAQTQAALPSTPVTSPRHADFVSGQQLKAAEAAAQVRDRKPVLSDADKAADAADQQLVDRYKAIARHPADHRHRHRTAAGRSTPGRARHLARTGAASRHARAAVAPSCRLRASPASRVGAQPRPSLAVRLHRSSPRSAPSTASRATISRGRSRSRAAAARAWVPVSSSGADRAVPVHARHGAPDGAGRPERPQGLGRRRRAPGGQNKARPDARARPGARRRRALPRSPAGQRRRRQAPRQPERPRAAISWATRPSARTAATPNAPASAFTTLWRNKFNGIKSTSLPSFATGFGSGQPYYGGAPGPGVMPPLPSAAPLPDPAQPAAPMPSLMQQATGAPSTVSAPPAAPMVGQVPPAVAPPARHPQTLPPPVAYNADDPSSPLPDRGLALAHARALAGGDPIQARMNVAEVNRRYEEQNRETYTERMELQAQLPDLNAAASAGVDGVTLPERDIRRLFPPAKAQAIIGEFHANQAVGGLMRGVQWASPDQLQEMQRDISLRPGRLFRRPALAPRPRHARAPARRVRRRTAPTWASSAGARLAAKQVNAEIQRRTNAAGRPRGGSRSLRGERLRTCGRPAPAEASRATPSLARDAELPRRARGAAARHDTRAGHRPCQQDHGVTRPEGRAAAAGDRGGLGMAQGVRRCHQPGQAAAELPGRAGPRRPARRRPVGAHAGEREARARRQAREVDRRHRGPHGRSQGRGREDPRRGALRPRGEELRPEHPEVGLLGRPGARHRERGRDAGARQARRRRGGGLGFGGVGRGQDRSSASSITCRTAAPGCRRRPWTPCRRTPGPPSTAWRSTTSRCRSASASRASPSPRSMSTPSRPRRPGSPRRSRTRSG